MNDTMPLTTTVEPNFRKIRTTAAILFQIFLIVSLLDFLKEKEAHIDCRILNNHRSCLKLASLYCQQSAMPKALTSMPTTCSSTFMPASGSSSSALIASISTSTWSPSVKDILNSIARPVLFDHCPYSCSPLVTLPFWLWSALCQLIVKSNVLRLIWLQRTFYKLLCLWNAWFCYQFLSIT